MTRSTAPAAALLAAFLCAAGAVHAEEPPKCQLVRIAEWPVRLQRGMPITTGTINGHAVGVLVDTGADVSLVTRDTAEKLQLSTRTTSGWLSGFGGDSRVHETRLDELRLGEAARRNMRVRVAGERPFPGAGFVVGEDFLGSLDIEFEYAKGVIRLYQPLECKKVALAYWDAQAPSIEIDSGKRITFEVKVNGRAARAMLDSGASTSVVSVDFAAKVGITPASPGVVSSGCSSGIGASTVAQWVAKFDDVAIGDETIRDPHLRIADFGSDVSRRDPIDIILGTDFLRVHRVLVSRYQGKLYYSYMGGLVFPATPGLACDARPADKAPAAYDEAIAKDPQDVQARLNRALLRIRGKDMPGALADLDAAILIEPGNAVARGMRMGVRATLKDFPGALADSDAAMAGGVLNAEMHVARAAIRRSQGDAGNAIAELDQALKLDPLQPAALRVRGMYLFLTDRFADAMKDFTSLAAVRGDDFDSIWLALARHRAGMDAASTLEAALARAKDRWPAPVMSYLLGRIDREALLAAATASAENDRRGRVCEARFYIAERAIAEGHRDEARPFLESARDDCPEGYVEQEAAVVELAKPR